MRKIILSLCLVMLIFTACIGIPIDKGARAINIYKPGTEHQSRQEYYDSQRQTVDNKCQEECNWLCPPDANIPTAECTEMIQQSVINDEYTIKVNEWIYLRQCWAEGWRP